MATRLLEQSKWTKDGRKWVHYNWVDTLDGKRRKHFSSAFKTKKEALEAEREFMGSLTNNYTDGKITTFKDLYDAFYEYQEDKVKDTTLKTYKDRIKYMKMLDNVKLKDLNVQHYELWKKEMNKKDICTKYKNDIQKFIKAVLNFGTRIYGCDFTNFYPKIVRFTNPNEIEKEMDFYTLDEFKKFISNETDLKFKCLYETLYYCGLRKGEARGLSWKYIDFTNNEILVRENCVSHGESDKSYQITTLKTPSSKRNIPMVDVLIDDLKMLFEEAKKSYGFNMDWFVFGDFKPITNYKTRTQKNKLCKLAGLKQIRIHDFRHSCASLLINSNSPITVVAKYLGHAKIEETLNTYAHMFPSTLFQAVNTINNLNKLT